MNWTTTGQEVGKELRQFWQGSRPGSPARANSYNQEGSTKDGASLTSPSALSHLAGRLDLPRSDSPGLGSDFATGYSLGLIGGVRSWVSILVFLMFKFELNFSVTTNADMLCKMTRSRQTNRDSRNTSDDSGDDSDEKSAPRGRSGKDSVDEQVDATIAVDSLRSGH